MYPYSPSHLVYTSVHDQKADQRIQRKDFPGIHLDVHQCTSRENLSFELFDQ